MSRVDLEWPAPRDGSAVGLQAFVGNEPPRLPQLRPGAVRRWPGGPGWSPAGTQPISRYRRLSDGAYRVALGTGGVIGFDHEVVLGVLQVHHQHGTRRLVAEVARGDLHLTDDQDRLPDELVSLGYVEQAALPMLDSLELRETADGQRTLVAAVEDPLHGASRTIERFGFIEPWPIRPRASAQAAVRWGEVPLHQEVAAWGHVRRTGGDGQGSLGAAWARPMAGGVVLQVTPAGTWETELARWTPPRRSSRQAASWVAAPVGWAGRRALVRSWALRAAASRARHLVGGSAAQTPPAPPAGSVGWLRRTGAPGWRPLFSAVHPVTGDQLVTSAEIEALDLGYRVLGLLGWSRGEVGVEVPAGPELRWASHFGQRRRRFAGAWGPGR